MSQNLQLQKITPPKIRRIRHRRRLVVANGRFPSRQPALSNFLTREATRANTVGGVVGVTDQEILTAIQGVGTSTLNRDIGDTFDVQTDARLVRAATLAVDYTNAGIPIV